MGGKRVFLPRIELRTFRVLGGRDNHYTTETYNEQFSRAWFRSTDLWVMGPARFHCATLLPYKMLENLEYVECNQSVLNGIGFH